jgi:signal peptidase
MATTSSTDAPGQLVWLGRAVDLVLVGIVALGLTSAILGRVLPLTGHPVYVVAGPSMTPAIPMGAAVVLESVPPSALAVGDVVSLQSGPERAVFTHRITRVVTRDGAVWIETRGDANPAIDPSITAASAVIGRVAVSIPFAGYLLALLSTAPGIVLLLSAGIVMVIVGWVIDDLAAERRRRARRLAASGAAEATSDALAPPEADPVPLSVVLADGLAPLDPATRVSAAEASRRRRARHPIPPTSPQRRRPARGPRPRPTGHGA